MQRPYFLYRLSFPGGKLYIGITNSVVARWRSHRWLAKSGSKLLVHLAIRKHGWHSVAAETLACGSQDYIEALEIKAIRAFGTLSPNGYNISEGGDRSPMHHPETRAKVSASKLGKTHTVEARANMSAATRLRWATTTPEERAAMLAKRNYKHSPDTLQRMSAGAKGKPASVRALAAAAAIRKDPVLSSHARRKLSLAQTANWQRPEHQAKMAAVKTAIVYTPEMRARLSTGRKGKAMSDDQKAKLSRATKGVKKSEVTKQRMREAAKKRSGRLMSATERINRSVAARLWREKKRNSENGQN